MVVIDNSQRLLHFFRNSHSETVGKAGVPIPVPSGYEPLSASLLETSYSISQDDKKILELLVHLKSDSDNYLATYFMIEITKKWLGPFPIKDEHKKISAKTDGTRPVITANNWKDKGILHLLVPQDNNSLSYYWKDTETRGRVWKQGREIRLPRGYDVQGMSIIHAPKNFSDNQLYLCIHLKSNRDDRVYIYHSTGTVNPPRSWQLHSLSVRGHRVTGITGNPIMLYADWNSQHDSNFLIALIRDNQIEFMNRQAHLDF